MLSKPVFAMILKGGENTSVFFHLTIPSTVALQFYVYNILQGGDQDGPGTRFRIG